MLERSIVVLYKGRSFFLDRTWWIRRGWNILFSFYGNIFWKKNLALGYISLYTYSQAPALPPSWQITRCQHFDQSTHLKQHFAHQVCNPGHIQYYVEFSSASWARLRANACYLHWDFRLPSPIQLSPTLPRPQSDDPIPDARPSKPCLNRCSKLQRHASAACQRERERDWVPTFFPTINWEVDNAIYTSKRKLRNILNRPASPLPPCPKVLMPKVRTRRMRSKRRPLATISSPLSIKEPPSVVISPVLARRSKLDHEIS